MILIEILISYRNIFLIVLTNNANLNFGLRLSYRGPFFINVATVSRFKDSNRYQNRIAEELDRKEKGGEGMQCDSKTFAKMYEEIYVDLYRYALCMLKNRHEAEDAVSEAVIAAYENIRKLRKENAFKSWIFTILANVCKKKMKQATKEVHNGVESMDDWIAAESPDYGIGTDVRRAFFILSEEEQMIVGMSVFGGYNSKEIGKILGMNSNTVRSRRSRALQKMECILK